MFNNKLFARLLGGVADISLPSALEESLPSLMPRRKALGTIATVAIALLLDGGNASHAQIYIKARTFYISAAGNDSNSGTQASPWLTIGKANSAMMIAGDTFYFNGGDTFSDATITPTGGRTRFTSYGVGMATISRSAAAGFTATNFSGITVDNLIFTGSVGTTQAGISINNNSATLFISNFSVSNCIVSGYAGNGIEFVCTAGGIIANVNISNCTTHDCTLVKGGSQGTSGIHIFGKYGAQMTGVYSFSNVTISNCVSYNNPGVAGAPNWTGSGIFLAGTTGAVVKNCTTYNNGGTGGASGGAVGNWCADCNSVTFIACESYGNQTNTIDGDGFDLDGGCINCVIEYCYAHGNQGDGFLIFGYSDGTITANVGSTIRFCVAEKNCSGTNQNVGDICVYNSAGTTSGVKVYNNTVYGNTTTTNCGCLAVNKAFTGVIVNNIFFAASGTPIVTTLTVSALTIFGNNYWSAGSFRIIWNGTTYTSLAAWKSATSQDSAGLNVDPMLTNPGNGGTIGAGNPLSGLTAYKLLPSSPMIHAGQNLTTGFSIDPGPQDFYGNAITAATLSIGANCP